MTGKTSNRWEVKVEGHDFDLRDLGNTLEPNGYVLRQHDDTSWYLSGPNIECASDARDASSRAEKVVRNVNAALRVSRSSYRPVTMGSFVRDNETNATIAQLKSTIDLNFRVSASITTANGERDSSPPPFERQRHWIAAAEKDTAVQAVLDLLMSGREEFDMNYRIYEQIISDLENWQASCQLTGWDKSLYDDFKGTLSVPRHETPTNVPDMELSEAIRVADEFLQVWLDYKSTDIS